MRRAPSAALETMNDGEGVRMPLHPSSRILHHFIMDFPFTAIVGQEQMRLALLLNAIDPRIGGVLIRGERGTAKSTMARSLAALLPLQRVVRDCPYNCDPDDPVEQDDTHRGVPGLPLVERPVRVVTLPINATEDRVAGTLDVRAALAEGEYRFQPGLLAAAHRGILYIDEINLLPDHLVDLILDAAALGRNTVEREGFSVTHPSRFLLIGTMNPEEGDLRPQLLDRFGLCVDVAGITDVDARVEVVRRRMAFESDAAAFVHAWQPAQEDLRGHVTRARTLLPEVAAPDAAVRAIAALAVELGVDGHRADLVILRAAAALAALEGRREVTLDDARRAAALALPHRLRRRPFDQHGAADDRLAEAMQRWHANAGNSGNQADGGYETDRRAPPFEAQASSLTEGPGAPRAAAPDTGAPQDAPPPDGPSQPVDPLTLPPLHAPHDRARRGADGRRQPAPSPDKPGRTVRATRPSGPITDVALGATIRAAAQQSAEYRVQAPADLAGAEAGSSHVARSPFRIPHSALRIPVRERTVGAGIIFVVDASGSMGARQRMSAAKGAALTLLSEAYQRRDRVALIAFRGAAAELLLPLTNSVELAHRRLAELPTGGRTPLAAGLRAGLDLIRQTRLKDPRALLIPVLITDGRANTGANEVSAIDEALRLAAMLRQPGVHPLVLDAERASINLGLAAQLAERAGARYVRLADLSSENVAASVQAFAAESIG
jgi:magnesium chelatase subunit D